MKKVMVSPLAGHWFQNSERALRDELAECGKEIMVVRKKGVCAAVVPHAGYSYSGRVAAGVYLRINPAQFRRIIIIGPSHYVTMRNQISVPEATHYATPLGEVACDTEFVKQLRTLKFVTHQPEAHAREHSDQIQIPLIQMYLTTKVPIVCMVCGHFDVAELLQASEALKALLDDQTLVIVSSDFTHYGANYGYVPFKNDVLNKIECLDMAVFELFTQNDLKGFIKYLNETGATVCGRDPLALLLAMMPSDAKVERTGYETSGKILNDTKNSVSYIGALVQGVWSQQSVLQGRPLASEVKLADHDCERLLFLVRDTITDVLKCGNAKQAVMKVPESITDGMRAVRGGFVTLYKHGALRGCIGEILPQREIWKVVQAQAINAAFNDTRFRPLKIDELDEIQIEISVLTPPQPIASWREIKIGRHGVILTKNGHSAVFLPQVAPEQGWDVETTLTHLAVKAGLDSDAWQTGASFMVFEAQVISGQDRI